MPPAKKAAVKAAPKGKQAAKDKVESNEAGGDPKILGKMYQIWQIELAADFEISCE